MADVDPMIGFLCENTNFRLCRLAGVIENSGCDYAAIPTKGIPKVLSIIHLILAVIIAVFFCSFLSTIKDYKVTWIGQLETRGKWFYRIHLILMGVSILIWGIEGSLIPIDGSGLHFMICLRYVFLDASEALLVCIALVDTHLIGAGLVSFIVCTVISAIIGLLSFLMMVSSLAPKLIAIFGIGIPIGCALFHFFSMIGVCIVRNIKKGLLYLTIMVLANVLPIIFEMFLNEPLCTVTVGWFPGAPLGCVLYAFYRAFIAQFYTLLKKNGEKLDGTNGNRVKLGDEDGNMNIPALIDV